MLSVIVRYIAFSKEEISSNIENNIIESDNHKP